MTHPPHESRFLRILHLYALWTAARCHGVYVQTTHRNWIDHLDLDFNLTFLPMATSWNQILFQRVVRAPLTVSDHNRR